MIPIYGVPTCECRTNMRPRWSRDGGPRVFVCTRCGKPVPGYESLWWMRIRLTKQKPVTKMRRLKR